MQTKEERNTAARKRRIEKSIARKKSILHAYIEMYTRAAKEHWSHERMMEYEKQWLAAPCYMQQPRTEDEGSYRQGVKDTLWELHWRCLTFCYRHPDKPFMYRPAHELCEQGLASRLVTATGKYFYRNVDADIANEYVDAFNRELPQS